MTFYEKIKKKLKDYQEAAPERKLKREEREEERREKRREKLQHQLEVETLKERIGHTRASRQKAYLGVQSERMKLNQQRVPPPQLSSFIIGSPQKSKPLKFKPINRKAKPKKRKRRR